MPFKATLGGKRIVGLFNNAVSGNTALDLKSILSTEDRKATLLPTVHPVSTEVSVAIAKAWQQGQFVYDEDLKLPFQLRPAVLTITTYDNLPTTFKTSAAVSIVEGDEIYTTTNANVNNGDIIAGDVLLGTVPVAGVDYTTNIVTLASGNPSTATTALTTTSNKVFKVKKKAYYNGTYGTRGLMYFYFGINPEIAIGTIDSNIAIYQSAAGITLGGVQAQIDALQVKVSQNAPIGSLLFTDREAITGSGQIPTNSLIGWTEITNIYQGRHPLISSNATSSDILATGVYNLGSNILDISQLPTITSKNSAAIETLGSGTHEHGTAGVVNGSLEMQDHSHTIRNATEAVNPQGDRYVNTSSDLNETANEPAPVTDYANKKQIKGATALGGDHTHILSDEDVIVTSDGTISEAHQHPFFTVRVFRKTT